MHISRVMLKQHVLFALSFTLFLTQPCSSRRYSPGHGIQHCDVQRSESKEQIMLQKRLNQQS